MYISSKQSQNFRRVFGPKEGFIFKFIFNHHCPVFVQKKGNTFLDLARFSNLYNQHLLKTTFSAHELFYCPQPTQSNPQRKQSGNKSNGIESLGPSNLLSFLSFLSALSQKKMPGRRKTGKNAPILSHEFVITNHGDIVSCICMVFMMGLMFQVRFSLFGGVV